MAERIDQIPDLFVGATQQTPEIERKNIDGADAARPVRRSDRATVEAVIAESVRQDTPAGVEIPPLEAEESDFSEGGFLMPPGEPPATAAPPIPRKSSTAPASTATPDPPPVARPRHRAALPRVAVDRLEELAAPDFAFNLDVREVHSIGERKETREG